MPHPRAWHQPHYYRLTDVLINDLPALRVGDSSACGDTLTEGIGSILINGKPIAFLGSATAHGGVIVTGSGDVLVGTQSGSAFFSAPEILTLRAVPADRQQ